MKTSKFLYNEMIIKGRSLDSIQKEYALSFSYIIRKVHDYMVLRIRNEKNIQRS